MESIMSIISFSPTTVQAGSLNALTITGINYTANDIKIIIGEEKIHPFEANETTLKCYVPAYIKTGNYKIIISNDAHQEQVKSEQDLMVTTAKKISLTEINPNNFSLSNAYFGRFVITLKGSDFSANANDMILRIGNISVVADESASSYAKFTLSNTIPNISAGVFQIRLLDLSTTKGEIKSNLDFTITN